MNDMKKFDEVVDTKNSKKQKGASMVEYSLLVALIAIISIAAIQLLGQRVSSKFSQAASSLATS